MRAWQAHEAELRVWLRARLGSWHDAEDLLQELFLKALRKERGFCEIRNARAWLFEVARNALADRLRTRRDLVELPEDLIREPEELSAVDGLADCLPRALAALSAEDREAITFCDLEGRTQAELAQIKGLSLTGAKSRVQRARKRLRAQLTSACQVHFDETGRVCCFVPRVADG